MNNEKQLQVFKGLQGIYVDESKICYIDGNKGILKYRGHSIEKLIQKSFVQNIHLLLEGEFPTKKVESDLNLKLSNCLRLDEYETSLVKSISKDLHPMKVLQGILPLLKIPRFDSNNEKELFLFAKISGALCALQRLRTEQSILSPKVGMSFLENFFYCFHGKRASEKELEIFKVVQILQMEHSFNASTFAGRVTASTLAPLECCLSTSIGTLFGKLHGGADQAALEMAMEIKSLQEVETFVTRTLENRGKIWGMGHRVYKTVDPRAKILKPMAKNLCEGTPLENLYLVMEEIEICTHNQMKVKGKDIWANIEFYKGIVFYTLGFPIDYFTALFAMARSIGYIAHVNENLVNNKIIRPKALYIGE